MPAKDTGAPEAGERHQATPERPENKCRCFEATQFVVICVCSSRTRTCGSCFSRGSLAQGAGGREVSAFPGSQQLPRSRRHCRCYLVAEELPPAQEHRDRRAFSGCRRWERANQGHIPAGPPQQRPWVCWLGPRSRPFTPSAASESPGEEKRGALGLAGETASGTGESGEGSLHCRQACKSSGFSECEGRFLQRLPLVLRLSLSPLPDLG